MCPLLQGALISRGGVWMLFLFFWWSVTVKDEYTRRGYSSLPKWHCLILGKDRCVLNEEKLIITNASNFMVSSIVIYWELYANWDSKAWRYHWFFLALSFGISFHRFQLLFALLFLQKKSLNDLLVTKSQAADLYLHVSCRAACRSAASKSVDSILIIND